MTHAAVGQFTELYERLPLKVQKLADNNFSVIKEYPNHPLLRLLKVDGLWSMRIGSTYRALGAENGETIVWFWIGKYKHYTAFFQ